MDKTVSLLATFVRVLESCIYYVAEDKSYIKLTRPTIIEDTDLRRASAILKELKILRDYILSDDTVVLYPDPGAVESFVSRIDYHLWRKLRGRDSWDRADLDELIAVRGDEASSRRQDYLKSLDMDKADGMYYTLRAFLSEVEDSYRYLGSDTYEKLFDFLDDLIVARRFHSQIIKETLESSPKFGSVWRGGVPSLKGKK